MLRRRLNSQGLYRFVLPLDLDPLEPQLGPHISLHVESRQLNMQCRSLLLQISQFSVLGREGRSVGSGLDLGLDVRLASLVLRERSSLLGDVDEGSGDSVDGSIERSDSHVVGLLQESDVSSGRVCEPARVRFARRPSSWYARLPLEHSSNSESASDAPAPSSSPRPTHLISVHARVSI